MEVFSHTSFHALLCQEKNCLVYKVLIYDYMILDTIRKSALQQAEMCPMGVACNKDLKSHSAREIKKEMQDPDLSSENCFYMKYHLGK